MAYFLLIIALIIPFVFIFSSKSKLKIEEIVIPKHLGRRTEIPLKTTISHLEKALNPNYEQKIKDRFMIEHKRVSDHEFQLLLFELKRFFVMSSLMKSVPMFSDKVDDVWHTMLMFTKEYNQFSHSFCGQFIHHIPIEKRFPQTDDRALFDLIYTQLFECTPYSTVAWGSFFRNPINSDQLREFRYSSVEELTSKYFQEYADDNIVKALIHQIKIKIEESLGGEIDFQVKPSYYKNLEVYAPHISGAMIYHSWHHPDQYKKYMIPQQTSSSSNCNSGCSGSGDSSCNESSCGSSCGSGCGGD